jgi:hypothetical protein
MMRSAGDRVQGIGGERNAGRVAGHAVEAGGRDVPLPVIVHAGAAQRRSELAVDCVGPLVTGPAAGGIAVDVGDAQRPGAGKFRGKDAVAGRALGAEPEHVEVGAVGQVEVVQARPAVVAWQGRVVADGGRGGFDLAVLCGLVRIGLDLDGREGAVVVEDGHVADPQAVGQVVQDRELAVFEVGLLDAREFGCPAGLAGECAGRRTLAAGDDVLALESEDAPCQRVADAFELADDPFAYVPLQLPGFQARGVQPGLRVRRALLRRLPGAHPLHGLGEGAPGSVPRIEVAQRSPAAAE